MAEIKYNSEQIQELLNNKYVKSCTNKNISFMKECKIELIKQWKSGIFYREIFRNLGFPEYIVNSKIPERSYNRWRRNINKKGNDVGSGSSIKGCFGIITIAVGKNWDYIKIAELLIHESVHLSLYISDMTYNLFNNYKSLELPETKTISSVLKIKRPLDGAFHSACVSFVIYNFYKKIRLKNNSDLILKDLKPALIDFNGKYKYLSDYSINLLEEIKNNT